MTRRRTRRNAGIAGLAAAGARSWPTLPLFWLFRKATGTQLTPPQLRRITQVVRAEPNCRLLVFGLGNDSFYWHNLNAAGETLFLESDESWIDLLQSIEPSLSVHKVNYWTERRDWKRLAQSMDGLDVDLPRSIAARKWDVVLVDGPAGWSDEQPGRMQSIYSASKLCSDGGTVFVHDSEREVEAFWCDLMFPRGRMINEVKGNRKHGWLREYRQNVSWSP